MSGRALPLAAIAITLAACNALSGAGDLAFCDDCASDDAGTAPDVVGDAAATPPSPDAGDRDPVVDASSDGAADADADARPPLGCQGAVACGRVVFVTSQTYDGALGGVAGADAKCQALADTSSQPRIRGRTFVAWVSTAQSAAATRFTHGSAPYALASGAVVALDWGDLTDGNLAHAIDVDEQGNKQNDGAWTGTNSNGATYSGFACTDWTVAIAVAGGDRGNVAGSGGGWSNNQTESCSLLHRLYCFEE